MFSWLRKLLGLDRIEAKLDLLLKEVKTMAQELDDLESQVTNTDGTMESVTVLLQGILDRLDQAGTDPARLTALKDALKARTDALAAAAAAIPPRPGS